MHFSDFCFFFSVLPPSTSATVDATVTKVSTEREFLCSESGACPICSLYLQLFFTPKEVFWKRQKVTVRQLSVGFGSSPQAIRNAFAVTIVLRMQQNMHETKGSKVWLPLMLGSDYSEYRTWKGDEVDGGGFLFLVYHARFSVPKGRPRRLNTAGYLVGVP